MNNIIKQDYHSEQDEEMSKDKRDFIINKNQKNIMQFIQENNYLLINGNKEIKIYNSLLPLISK